MKVFISWSGRRSREVAEALGPWLKKMMPSTEYFISTNMERGVKWLQVISASLDTHSLGIICVTPGNVDKPWINFEAGALSKHLGDEGRVIPYLLDFNSLSDLKDPLAQFNACQTTKDGTWQLVQTLNAHSEFKHDEGTMMEIFDVWWPKLQPQIEQITKSSSQPTERRSQDEKIDELLQLARALVQDARLARFIDQGEDSAWSRLLRLSSGNPNIDLRQAVHLLDDNTIRLLGSVSNKLISESQTIWQELAAVGVDVLRVTWRQPNYYYVETSAEDAPRAATLRKTLLADLEERFACNVVTSWSRSSVTEGTISDDEE